MFSIDDYDYELPAELIAQHPRSHRADARLLVVDRAREAISLASIRDLSDYIRPADALVLNDTRVLMARLVGYRTQTGGRWQGLFLDRDSQGRWQVLGRTRGKLQAGETITLVDRESQDGVRLRVLASQGGGVWVMQPESDLSMEALLDRFGRVPLPPYIRSGEMEPSDIERYQTVYAVHPGAVAAPTAGLHFTTQLLQQLQQQGTSLEQVTLHVGVGTFRPVSVEQLADHVMHEEWGRVTSDTVDRLEQRRAAGGRVVAVGTTVVRVLETASTAGRLAAWEGRTDLFIRPPHEFHSVDALLTNFHLPRSTLLVLVRTFGGDALIRRAYDMAVQEEMRFFSYGDAMLIL